MNSSELHSSWLEMEPLRVEHDNKEFFDDYYSRIGLLPQFSHIDESVFEQWLYEHHENHRMRKNYGWINYHEASISLEYLDVKRLLSANVIRDFRPYYSSKCRTNKLNHISPIAKTYWMEYGTWKTAPIILENMTCARRPVWAEIEGEIQLIEGHTRLGFLHAFYYGQLKGTISLQAHHAVWVLRNKSLA